MNYLHREAERPFVSPPNRIVFWTAVVVLVSLFPLLLCAQDATQNGQPGMKTPAAGTHHQVMVTGCLKRRSEPGHYYMTDRDSRTWELSSTSVDLAKEINHVVTVSGHEKVVPKPEAAKNPQDQKAAAGGDQFSYYLTVLELTTLSTSCTR